MLKDFFELHHIGVVFLGSFNPVIIQPFWLANKKLIRDVEAKNAVVDIVHQDITRFSLDWLTIEVTPNRFTLKTTQEPFFEPMKDLILSLFSILQETPLQAVGINHLRYYALPNEERYYGFGDKLVPLSLWKEALVDPRLINLEIVEQKRKDKLPGSFSIKIQPSDLQLSTPFGVLITTNDHLGLSSPKGEREGEIIETFSNNWASSLQRSSEVINSIDSKL